MSDIEITSFGLNSETTPILEGKYLHFKIDRECQLEETAKRLVEIYNTMITTLSTTHNVYVRTRPQYYRNNKFDSDKTEWLVIGRISITLPTISGRPAGLLVGVQGTYRYE